jgi:hypothetical protein
MRLSSLVSFVRIHFLIVLPLLVGGCVTMTAAPDPLKVAPRDGTSTVVVSVTTNTAEIRGFDGLVVRKINAPGVNVVDLNSLNLIVPGLARDTSVFIGMLPEGEYEFAEFTDLKSNRKLALGQGQRDLIGRFRVTRDKPVDLGRLVLTPANYNVVMGRSETVTSNKPLLEKFAPEYAALLKGEPSDGWLRFRSRDDTIEQYALSRPVGLDYPVELEDGTVVGASRLGTVLVRSPGGKWRLIRSAGIESLLCAMPVKLSDASLIAVGEFNTMLRLAHDSRLLTPIGAGNLPPGNLIFIAGDETHGWYVAQQRADEVVFYRSAKLENGDWHALRKESVGRSFWNGADQIWIWRTPLGFSYAVSDGRISHLDFGSTEWRVVKAPNDSRLINVSPNPDDSIGILTSPGGGMGGVFAGTHLSQDQGTTWREIVPPNKIKQSPPIRMPGGPVMTVSLSGVFSGVSELHASRDEGATWEKRDGFRAGERLLPLKSGRMLSIQPGTRGVFSVATSVDEGRSWRVEYSNFDNALYEAQQKKK